MPTRDKFAVASAVLFAAGAVYAIVHLVWFRPYGMLSVDWSLAVSLGLSVLWSAAAVTLAMRMRGRSPRSSVVLAWAGTFAALGAGLVFREKGDVNAFAPLLIGAMIQAVLVKRAFTPLPWHAPAGD